MLAGTYRGTNEKVNTDDIIGRMAGIEALKQIHNWDLISNPKKYKIDLLHKNKKGGVDVEEGKWLGRYHEQDFFNFNQYTLDEPTGNFPIRKEKYFNEYYDSITDNGNLKTHHHPDYKDNALMRFNGEINEFFFADYKTYVDTPPLKGAWIPKTVYKVDRYGNKVMEYWLAWRLCDLDFYVLENGIWRRDDRFKDPLYYEEFVKKYRIEREKYLKNINK